MTATPDFAAIIAANITADEEAARDALAAPIAAMCPDCKGTGYVALSGDGTVTPGRDAFPCTHPNAPTVGQALHEWADAHQRAATNGHTIDQALKVYEAVMEATVGDGNAHLGDMPVHFADTLIGLLREVAR